MQYSIVAFFYKYVYHLIERTEENMDFNNFDAYIGDKLYIARVTKRLTQDDVAKRISTRLKEKGTRKNGISRQAYAFYEKGERSMPMDVYACACEVLSLDKYEVFNSALDSIKLKKEEDIDEIQKGTVHPTEGRL